MDPKKRELRKLKREVKRAGNKKRRLRLKQDLERNPEEAQHSEEKLGRYRSAHFNGLDADSTRRKPTPAEDDSAIDPLD